MALRHLVLGPVAPGSVLREAMAGGIGETGRLALFLGFCLCLGLVDPETRNLGAAAIGNTFDDASRLQGLMLLAVGAVVIGFALLLAYWSAAAAALALSGAGWPRGGLGRMRSIVAVSAWASLLPTIAVKVLALGLLPPAKIAADPPSLYSAIEAAMVIPYFAVCLTAAFGVGLARSILVATLVNGAFYLLVVILYVVAPS